VARAPVGREMNVRARPAARSRRARAACAGRESKGGGARIGRAGGNTDCLAPPPLADVPARRGRSLDGGLAAESHGVSLGGVVCKARKRDRVCCVREEGERRARDPISLCSLSPLSSPLSPLSFPLSRQRREPHACRVPPSTAPRYSRSPRASRAYPQGAAPARAPHWRRRGRAAPLVARRPASGRRSGAAAATGRRALVAVLFVSSPAHPTSAHTQNQRRTLAHPLFRLFFFRASVPTSCERESKRRRDRASFKQDSSSARERERRVRSAAARWGPRSARPAERADPPRHGQLRED
jgi:hypothetical protein